jgi:hypothetical protein
VPKKDRVALTSDTYPANVVDAVCTTPEAICRPDALAAREYTLWPVAKDEATVRTVGVTSMPPTVRGFTVK